jgi:FKBP-type peptidyl-prolyl cis-trans isomerase SlyD
MEIGKDKVVTLAYELRLGSNNGKLIESTSANDPAVFLFGAGILLEKFEENLNGKRVGDSFAFNLDNEDAYGEHFSENIIGLPIGVFEIDGEIDREMLEIGNVVPMQDESGNHMNGKVVEVTEDEVKMDFNHPLAGENLHFSGTVLDIRVATSEELQHGHVHGPHGHHH